MGRELISYRITPLTSLPCDSGVSWGISNRFRLLSPCTRQIAHALLTRPPLSSTQLKIECWTARLACVRHAASVRPEPGSNSPIKMLTFDWLNQSYLTVVWIAHKLLLSFPLCVVSQNWLQFKFSNGFLHLQSLCLIQTSDLRFLTSICYTV